MPNNETDDLDGNMEICEYRLVFLKPTLLIK